MGSLYSFLDTENGDLGDFIIVSIFQKIWIFGGLKGSFILGAAR